MSKLRAGIDIGGTKASVGLMEGDRLLGKRRVAVRREAGCAAVMEDVADELRELCAEMGVPMERVGFCGIGVPGTVSADGRSVRMAPNLGWMEEPCAELFTGCNGIPAALVQDARAAALAEQRLGAARGRSAVLCVTLGTGIGTGIVLGGQIYHGALGGAGEVGHIPAVADGRACGCGRLGCVEAYSAGRGIAQTAAEHPQWKGPATSEAVFAAATAGNTVARGILTDAVAKLGAALSAVINVLSPDALIFSGGMCAQRELYVQPLTDYIRTHAYALSVAEGLLIAPAHLGEDAPMVGAALLNT